MGLRQSHYVSGNRDVHVYIESEDINQDNVILRHYDFLVDRMSPEFGLIDKLYSNRTLSNLQRNEIEAKSVTEKKNKILLKHIVEKKAFEKLLEALRGCSQSHLVQYLEEDGVYRPKFGGNWPLEEKENTTILNNYETLIDLLESRDLVGMLYQNRALSRRQRDLVNSKVTTAEQNKILLEILRKGSLDNYWQTIRCLHLSNQSHIAQIFESGGVVVRIDANLQPRPSNLNEVENSLAEKITNLLRHTPHAEASRILENVQLNLVGAASMHSVSLYFLCSYLGDIDRLKQMASDGQLKEFMEDLFNQLMTFRTRIEVTFKRPRHLFSKSRNYLKAIQVENVFDKPKKTTIECLPLELLDTILQKAYLWSRLRSGVLNDDEDSDIIRFLASVDASWFQRIHRKRFKKSIWPHLKRIYREKFEMYFSFKGCLRYLEEAIPVEEVRVKRQDLMAADLFTDLQIAKQIKRNGAKAKRRGQSGMIASLAEEFILVKRGLERKNFYNNFISFFRQTKRATEATVLDQDGTVAKVNIRKPKNIKTDTWSREFSGRLNNLKHRNQLKSGLEILNSFVDRGVTVWIWCKSPEAVKTLKALYESQTLIDHLYRLGNENDRNIGNNDIHFEEFHHLKVDKISPRNLVINPDGELRIEEAYERLIGVTKLGNKIFVGLLARSSPFDSQSFAVHVFEDQHPFKLLREMTFKEIKNPTKISSFEKNFCLYIADPGNKCIWKIYLQDEDKIEDGKFPCKALKCPEFSSIGFYTITITAKGHILIVDGVNPILLFCKRVSDMYLYCPIRINLPVAIYQPEEVAENSSGNFIFLHRSRERYDSGGGKNQWIVSEVGRNGGTIIRQYFGIRDQWLKRDEKASLLVDSKDRIFFSDTNNHRLILLDSRLQYLQSFALGIEVEADVDKKDEDLHYPEKMFYDGRKNQLIASGWKKVFVYKIA